MGKFDTHGGYFAPDNYIRVNEGDSHEENANGGVQMGVDPEGVPNLVEEDEVVYDDYVFSDNITTDEEMQEKYNLPRWAVGKLYSAVADKLVTEAEDRPNDPISNKGLEAMLGRLRDAQEEQKALKEQRDLEDELAQLSPEELDQLEQMLAEPQAMQGAHPGGDPVGSQGYMGAEDVMAAQAEQIPAEPMPIGDMPMMALGGQINKYDGESKKTGFLRRWLSSPVSVPNMTGTATAAATSLGSIPKTQSTVGREAAVAGAALSAPAIYALAANPFVQTAADAYFTIDGVRNAMSDNGIAKTARLVEQAIETDDDDERNKLIWDAVKSGAVDVLDITGAIRLARDAGKVGKAIYHSANGVALTPEQVAERLKKAKDAAEDARKSKELVDKTREKAAPLLKELEKTDKKKAQLVDYAAQKKKQIDKAQKLLDESDDAIENLVKSQEDALSTGSSIPGFDVKLRQYDDVRNRRQLLLDGKRETLNDINNAIEKYTDDVSDLSSKYNGILEKSGLPSEFHPMGPTEAKVRRVLGHAFNPFYGLSRADNLMWYDDAIGVDAFKDALKPLIAPSVGATMGLYALDKNYNSNNHTEKGSPESQNNNASPTPYVGAGIAPIDSTSVKQNVDTVGWNPSEAFDDAPQNFSAPVEERIDTLRKAKSRADYDPIRDNMYHKDGGPINKFDAGGDAYRRFMDLVTNYNVSKNRGGIDGTYRIDRNFSPYLYGNADLAALENDPRFTGFTDMVVQKAKEGNKRALMYLYQLDNGVADWTKRLFDENGNLRDGWESIYRERRRDGDAGIYHLIPQFANAGELDGFFDGPETYSTHNWMSWGKSPDLTRRPIANTGLIEEAPGGAADDDTVDNKTVASPYLSTIPRYAGATMAGLLGLYNAFQQPDRYNIPHYNPVLPQGQLHLTDPVYNPLDQEQAVNSVLASNAGTNRRIVNSGMGPSVGATLLASDYNAGQNMGAARQTVWDANNQRRNAVIAAKNQNAGTLANFDYGQSRDRAQILNDAAMRNMQNDLIRQRLNYESEGQKYAAIQSNLDTIAQALSGIGQENRTINAINSNNALYHLLSPNGIGAYKSWLEEPKKDTTNAKCGGKIKRKK